MKKIETTLALLLQEPNSILLEDYLQMPLQNTEGTLILNQAKLYKLFHYPLNRKKRKVMEYLFNHEKELFLPIHLEEIIYDQNEFLGYSMTYYENYETLSEIVTKDISLNERKRLAKELILIYQKMKENQVIYYDWHSKNVLVNDDIKLIDIDSSYITKDVKIDCISRRYLFVLIHSILLGIDLDFSSNLTEEDKITDIESFYEETLYSDIIPLDFEVMFKIIEEYTLILRDTEKEYILKHMKKA